MPRTFPAVPGSSRSAGMFVVPIVFARLVWSPSATHTHTHTHPYLLWTLLFRAMFIECGTFTDFDLFPDAGAGHKRSCCWAGPAVGPCWSVSSAAEHCCWLLVGFQTSNPPTLQNVWYVPLKKRMGRTKKKSNRADKFRTVFDKRSRLLGRRKLSRFGAALLCTDESRKRQEIWYSRAPFRVPSRETGAMSRCACGNGTVAISGNLIWHLLFALDVPSFARHLV